MKIADVLRKLADTIDHHGDDPREPDEKIVNPGRMIAIDNTAEVCPACGQSPCKCDGESEQPDDLFVPPMQLKLELLKKAVGVENIYDETRGEGDDAVGIDSNQSDDADLARMRQLAAIMNASDDEPLDD